MSYHIVHAKRNKMKWLKYLSIVVIILAFSACGRKEAPKKRYTPDDIANIRIGVPLGSVQDHYMTQHYPGKPLVRANAAPDLPLLLKEHEVDAIVCASIDYESVKRQYPQIYLVTDQLDSIPVCAAFNKNNKELREQFDHFLEGLIKSGQLEKIRRYWFEEDDGTFTMPADIPVYTTGKPLRYAIVGRNIGYNFYRNNEPMGMEVELVKRFAATLKRPTEVSTIEFSGLLAAVVTNKVDIAAAYLGKTEERAKAVDFSIPYHTTHSSCFAFDESAEQASFSPGAWVDNMKESFVTNIIKEDRYQLILKGLWVTVLISVCAALLGTVLGGIVCWLRMSRRKALRNVARCYITIMRGIPMLVFLMLMFYVFLAPLQMGGVTVAIIAFAMNFAAYVSEMFRTSIEGVDHGQTEAGIAMGFTPVQTFVHIVLPQAVRSVTPVYKGEIIGLIKSTSIVGYIAVEDLTKASDLIRSRTFDAFFPLLFSALIYFALAWLAITLLDKLTKPKHCICQ